MYKLEFNKKVRKILKSSTNIDTKFFYIMKELTKKTYTCLLIYKKIILTGKLLLKVKAQAETNKKISQFLTDNLIKYEYIKSWDGKLPTIVGSNGNIFNFSSNLIK